MYQMTWLNVAPSLDLRAYFTDGMPLLHETNVNHRLMINGYGFLDMSETLNGTSTYNLTIGNSTSNAYQSFARIELDINPDYVFIAKLTADFTDGSHESQFSGVISAPNTFSPGDVQDFWTMVTNGIIPYRNLPPPAIVKSVAEIVQLGEQYFPNVTDSEPMAYSIYDWTTANFFRFLLFTDMVYTGVGDQPLDLNSIYEMIWQHYYPPNYVPSNPDFMNMFGLPAVTSENEIAAALTGAKATELKQWVASEMNLFRTAVLKLPKLSTSQYPTLYRGAMPLDTKTGESTINRFAAQMLEFPGNAGPADVPLEMDIRDALNTFLTAGSTFTPKACWSFTDSYTDALNYQNGIIVVASPASGYYYWPSGGDILPFSVNPQANEFNFPARTRYRLDNASWVTPGGKMILQLEVTMLGTYD